jgi:hypothetical protein
LLINPTNANLGAKVAFAFFALSLPPTIWLYFYLPEFKGRTFLELVEMFSKRVPARQFKKYNCELEISTMADGEKVVNIVHDEGTA